MCISLWKKELGGRSPDARHALPSDRELYIQVALCLQNTVNRLFCSHNLVDFCRLRKCDKVCGVYINLNSTVGVEWKLSKILIVGRYQRLMSSKIAYPFGERHWLNNRPQTS